jgi:hypothetical protein
MKKLIAFLPVALFLTACGSTDVYQKRAEDARERQAKFVERSISQAPKWMTELPKSTGAVYANGTAVSGDLSMADEKAKIIALGKICVTAGGEVDMQSRVFRSDVGETSTENSEMAVRGMCRKVDVTGAEIVEIKRVAEGSRYRTYMLVALPLGDANTLKRDKVNDSLARQSITRSTEAFKELDVQTTR